ncbi:MAG: sensor histidine kinase [Thermomicrobiales bacterium]
MTAFFGLPRAIANAYARRLSWKLTFSHLLVVVISEAAYLVAATLVLYVVASLTNGTNLPEYSPAMAQETRALAALVADPLASRSPAELSALLAALPPRSPTGSGAFDGSLSPDNVLVVVTPDQQIRASSSTEAPAGEPLNTIQPPVWGVILTNALQGERDPHPPHLMGRDEAMRVLVTAYPITDQQGRIVGALGLRSAPAARSDGLRPVRLLASISLVIFGQLVLIGILAGFVSTGAGFLLARSFSRRLRKLEEAAEAIAAGDLSRRVAVTAPDEIGRLGERFNWLATRLQEVDSNRRAFVSNISHELRTPLAIIRGHVDAQLDAPDGATPPATRDALAIIDREARTLGDLVDDLFTLSRLEEAALPLQPAPVNVREVADAAVSGIQPLALARGQVAVRALVPADLPPALADRTRLAQILSNLLHNALRHTPDGGVIVVEGALMPDGRAIALTVTDTGAGIAPADLPHIFDRFYQGERAGHHQDGSGLGLAIVRQLVEAQGGTIAAESTPGQGASIRFTLPRA